MTTLQQIHQLVDEIEGCLYAISPDTGIASELAQRYEAESKLANERLRACSDLLRRGLRGEAIHLSEEEPNLVEMVAALDFPERHQWIGLTQLIGLGEPPDLLVELASELNEAFPVRVCQAKKVSIAFLVQG